MSDKKLDAVRSQLLAESKVIKMHVRPLTYAEAAEVLEPGGDDRMPAHLAAARYEFSCGCYDDMLRLVHAPGETVPDADRTETMVLLRHGHGISVSGRCERHANPNNGLFDKECGVLAAELFRDQIDTQNKVVLAKPDEMPVEDMPTAEDIRRGG